jgi:hypothetical protein
LSSPSDELKKLHGLVASINLTGQVDSHYSDSISNVRSYNDLNGFQVEYITFHGYWLEVGRDEAVKHALKYGYEWIMQIDADAAPIPPNIVEYLLRKLFIEQPDADVIGAYCQLKGPPHLPTIDTGTGRWEEIYPGSGIMPVIRTGAHCFIAKTSAYRKFGPPWYKTRSVHDPRLAFAEVDNFLRCRLAGDNPLTKVPEWHIMVNEAAKGDITEQQHVGEDSGFCDRLMAAGGRIYVDTDLVVGHVTKKIIEPKDLKDHMDERRTQLRQACGLLS